MKKIILFLAALLLNGCTHEMPVGQPFKPTEQAKLNSASHWDVLAHNEASLIRSVLGKSSALPIFIKKPDKEYPFSQAYHHLLTSNLAREGITVLTKPDTKALSVSYSVDIVEHKSKYMESRALATPLAKGIYQMALTKFANGTAGVLTSAMEVVKSPFYAVGNQFVPNLATPVEVVITTQMFNSSHVVSSDSKVYYIENANLSHYSHQKSAPLPHLFTLTDHQ